MARLCNHCILPENFAGITFSEQGICNLCEDYKSIRYLGEDRLKEDVNEILKHAKKGDYDCVVGLSGGRDSTYLLWYIVRKLKIRPLALFIDSKLIPIETLSNIKKTVNLLGVDLVIKQHEYLQRSIKHFLKTWAKYPHPASLITLCTGCRFGLLKLLNAEAVNRNIPIVFEGGTLFEEGSFKKNLISQNSDSNLAFVLGYGKQVIKNPALISNPGCLKIQIDELFTMPWGPFSKNRRQNYVHFTPFKQYFRWEEKKIEETIQTELEWKRFPGLASSYRGDCDIGIIRQYLYNKILGYNDKDDHLSWLIRDEQLSRKEALERIEIEKEIPLDILRSSFAKLGFNFDEFMVDVEINARKNGISYKS